MVTRDVLKIARTAAKELRRRGEVERAQAIEILAAAADAEAAPQPEPAGADEMDDLFGVESEALRRWVAENPHAGYRVGSVPVPREVVEEYVRRAGTSLDLEPIPDDEAARLVAEGRRHE